MSKVTREFKMLVDEDVAQSTATARPSATATASSAGRTTFTMHVPAASDAVPTRASSPVSGPGASSASAPAR